VDTKPIRRIALIGFGEAGGILGQDFAAAGFAVTATDILIRSEGLRGAMSEKARAANVQAHAVLRDAIEDADLVISAVTCSAALDAAKEAAAALRPDQFFVDINSVSPETKREIAAEIVRSGAKFVEAAVMASFSPQRLKVPMSLGGKHASEAAILLQSIGLHTTVVSDRIGVASAIKMCRSIVIKGLEALAVESLFAARRYDAEAEVLASLTGTVPHMGWHAELPDYLVSRVARHGRRRAAEMREVAETLKDIDMEPLMTLATAERQDWLVDTMAALAVSYDAARPFSWRELADQLNSNNDTSAGPSHNGEPGGAKLGK
jgi:3-hydroxyisobutyrate dehydrogenase-like beta-hydroxyacid dehydrogenase